MKTLTLVLAATLLVVAVTMASAQWEPFNDGMTPPGWQKWGNSWTHETIMLPEQRRNNQGFYNPGFNQPLLWDHVCRNCGNMWTDYIQVEGCGRCGAAPQPQYNYTPPSPCNLWPAPAPQCYCSPRRNLGCPAPTPRQSRGQLWIRW